MQSARAKIAALGHFLLDRLFPPVCLACRKAIVQHGALCAQCWQKMAFIERPYCERLGIPFAQDLGSEGLLSPEAIANPPAYARARAVARFEEGPTRQLVHRLKFGDRLDLAGPMGAWMARAGTEILVEADALIPIPLHPSRLRKRKFNHSGALAEAVSRHCGVPVRHRILQRIKPTSSQIGLSRSQRALNVQGAFQVKAEDRLAIEGARVVLVDDVLTSGATINAASRALLRAGAAQVEALVFARVVRE